MIQFCEWKRVVEPGGRDIWRVRIFVCRDEERKRKKGKKIRVTRRAAGVCARISSSVVGYGKESAVKVCSGEQRDKRKPSMRLCSVFLFFFAASRGRVPERRERKKRESKDESFAFGTRN